MLPDNSMIEISSEKQRAPEILLTPEKYGLEMPCNIKFKMRIFSDPWDNCKFDCSSGHRLKKNPLFRSLLDWWEYDDLRVPWKNSGRTKKINTKGIESFYIDDF
jgi:hypothetical protein